MPHRDGARFACITDLFGANEICIHVSLKLSKHGFLSFNMSNDFFGEA